MRKRPVRTSEGTVSNRVTIYDVAKAAHVSAATVSRVMNEPSMVAAEKRQAVLDAIRKLDFVPKVDAVINARKAYRKIGVVAPFFTQPSFMERLRGISRVLGAEHYELVIYSIDTEDDLEQYVGSLVAANRVDGLIFLCVRLAPQVLKILRQAKFPVCFVENEVEGFDCVVIRNLEGGMKAGDYLWDLGCRNPGFIGEAADRSYVVSAMEDRLRGFRFSFANKGIVAREENFWIGQFGQEGLDEGIDGVLSLPEPPDCIFCSSDLIASRVMLLAGERGFAIPGRLKLLGFDNIDIAPFMGLSSVDQKLDDSGSLAARLLLARIADPDKAPGGNSFLDLEIVRRASTEGRDVHPGRSSARKTSIKYPLKKKGA